MNRGVIQCLQKDKRSLIKPLLYLLFPFNIEIFRFDSLNDLLI